MSGIQEGIQIILRVDNAAAITKVRQVENEIHATIGRPKELKISTAEAQAGLKQTKQKVDSLQYSIKKNTLATERGMHAIKRMAVQTALQFVGISMAIQKVRQALQTFFDFDREMTLVSTLTTYTMDEMSQLRDHAKNIAVETGQSITDVAKGLYGTITAGVQQEFGFNLEDVARVTKAIQELASIQGSAVRETTRAVMGLVNLFGQELGPTIDDQIEKTRNLLFQTSKLGITTVEEIAQSIGFASPLWKQAGLQLEDLLASVVHMTRGGLGTANAITAMRAALVAVMKPGQAATKMADQLGIDFSVAGLRAKGYIRFMQDIMEKTDGANDKLVKLFPNIRALIEILTKAGGMDEIFKIRAEFEPEKLFGAVDTAIEKVRDSMEFRQREIEARWQIFWENLGKGASGFVLDLQETMLDAVNLFDSFAKIRLKPPEGFLGWQTQEESAWEPPDTSGFDDGLAPAGDDGLAPAGGNIGMMMARFAEDDAKAKYFMDGLIPKSEQSSIMEHFALEQKHAEKMIAWAEKESETLREIQYQKEREELAHLGRMEDFISSNFKRRANIIKSELATEVRLFEDAQKKQAGFAARFEASEVGFEERRSRIISAGLSPEGKDIQSRGMADFFRQRMDVSLGQSDFSQALTYAKKMQEIFGGLAERQENQFKSKDFDEFLASQDIITNIIKREQEANDQAIESSRKRIEELTDDLSTLFVELQNELIIDVSTDRAMEQLEDLRKAFVELRKDFSGLLPGGENFAYEIDPEKTLFEKPAQTPAEKKAQAVIEQEKTNMTLAEILSEVKKLIEARQDIERKSSSRGFHQDTSGNFVRETVRAN